MIVKRYVHKDDELAQHLNDHLNIPLDWPQDGGLTAQHVAGIAAAAACDVAYDQAAGSHLLDLIAALPLPDTEEGRTLWRALWHTASSDNAHLLPANLGPVIGYAAHGESGLADQVLSFISKLTPAQREAAAKVIGEFFRACGPMPHRPASCASTTRRSPLGASSSAERRHQRQEQRERFFKAWRNA